MAPARKKQAVGSGDKPSAASAASPPPESSPREDSPPLSGAYAPISPPSRAERESWPGFVERESEPAFFNTLLQDLGVKDVRLQEVIQFDAELLEQLPQPIYGVLYLSRWRERDNSTAAKTCPTGVWFANQISDNACSTISLLNILNNAPLELGPELTAFKDFTRDLTPYLRGDSINHSDHIRKCHNSLARKSQMMIDDLAQQRAFEEDRKKPANSRGSGGKKRKRANDDEDAQFDQNASNHYLAFVPVNGKIWMLDGLERQPQQISTYKPDEPWTNALEPWIDNEIERMQGDMACNIMAVVRDPLCGMREGLASNIKTLHRAEAALDEQDPEWGARMERTSSQEADDREAVRDACPTHGVSESMITEATADTELVEGKDLPELMEAHKDLVDKQSRLRNDVLVAKEAAVAERKKTEDRKHDFGPLIAAWLGRLAEKEGVIKELLDKV